MKVAILAGGVGTRLVEETEIKSTPVVEIGDKKLVEHLWQGGKPPWRIWE